MHLGGPGVPVEVGDPEERRDRRGEVAGEEEGPQPLPGEAGVEFQLLGEPARAHQQGAEQEEVEPYLRGKK